MIPYKQRKQAQQIMEAFTRQHYVAIANQIKLLKSELADNTGDLGVQDVNASVKRFADNLASMFKQDNPSFDKARFMSACGF